MHTQMWYTYVCAESCECLTRGRSSTDRPPWLLRGPRLRLRSCLIQLSAFRRLGMCTDSTMDVYSRCGHFYFRPSEVSLDGHTAQFRLTLGLESTKDILKSSLEL